MEGDHGINSESLYAYELGYRVDLSSELSFDLSTFYNHYERLITTANGSPVLVTSTLPNYLRIPIQFVNSNNSDVYGFEFVSSYQATDWWRLQGWYSYLDMNVDKIVDNRSPKNQAVLRSLMTAYGNIEIDPTLRYVDSLSDQNVKAYVNLNLRLGYLIDRDLSISLIGTNLFHDSRQEFFPDESRRPLTEIERAFFLRVDLAL